MKGEIIKFRVSLEKKEMIRVVSGGDMSKYILGLVDSDLEKMATTASGDKKESPDQINDGAKLTK